MATENVALKEPVKVSKKSPFDKAKAPDSIIYRLVQRNDKLREDTPLYPPYKRFPNTDLIRWNYGTEKEPDWGERAIRWLPNYNTIFVDEQEKGNRPIDPKVLDNPNLRFEIINGDISVRPHERMKLLFLDYCNRNVDSPYKTGRVQGIFARYSEEKRVEDLKSKQEKQKIAMEKAFSADEAQVAFHAKYLGISTIDPQTGGTRTYDAILTDYRQVAMDEPKRFIETFDDEDLKLKYKIETALESNSINLNLIPGKAIFTATKEEICDVPVSQDIKYVVDSLFIFSQKKEGANLVKKLNDL